MSDGLYQRYRPADLDGVVGQPAAVKTIRGFKRVPNAVLLYGDSGCGKTTTAKILARMLGCEPAPTNMDYQEVNCSIIDSPIDTIRQMEQSMTALPVRGDARVWVLDEVQAFSKSKFAQQGMLRMLEFGPPHAFFFLCTTHPKQLIPTILNRCTQLAFKPVSAADLAALVKRVAAAERVKPPVDDRLAAKIAEAANGSPRVALVELEKVIGLSDPADRLAAAGDRVGSDKVAFELVKAAIPFKGVPNWPDVAAVIQGLIDEGKEDPEGLRQMVLSVARKGMLKEPDRAARCYKLVRCLDAPLYDAGSAWAVLTAAFFEIVYASKKG